MATLTINLNNVQPLDSILTELSELSLSGNALKYIRVNATADGFELETVSGGGMTIGEAVTGATANRVLYVDGSGDLADSSGLTYDGAGVLTISSRVVVPTLRASGSGGLLLENNNGDDVLLLGAGPGQGATFYGGVNIAGALAVDTNVLYVDVTNDRVGIGTATPSYPLQISKVFTSGASNYLFGAEFTHALGYSSGQVFLYQYYNSTTFALVNGGLYGYLEMSSGSGLAIGTGNTTTLTVTSGTITHQLFTTVGNNIWKLNESTELMRLTGTGLLTFGGITANDPALKKVNADLQVRLADDSAFANFQCEKLRNKVHVQAKTNGSGSPYAVSADESGTHFTNYGALAETYFNLPSAAAGLRYTFTTNASQRIRVVAAAGDYIKSYTIVSSSGGYVLSNGATPNVSITLECIDASTWQVVAGTIAGGTIQWTFA